MYFEKRIVLSTNIDSNQEIRLSALLRYMQDVATNHVDKLHFGHVELEKNNLIWVVARTDLVIHRLPKIDEEITLYTHPGETKGFMFTRFFQVYDKHKNLLVSVSSIWVVLDYSSRKIMLHPFGERKLPEEVSEDDIPLPAKISGEATKLVDQRKARYSEVDMNGHINNTHYLNYILDTHSFDFFKNNKLTSVSINYEKEVLPGDVMDIYSNEENPEIIQGRINNQLSFIAKVTYTSR